MMTRVVLCAGPGYSAVFRWNSADPPKAGSTGDLHRSWCVVSANSGFSCTLSPYTPKISFGSGRSGYKNSVVVEPCLVHDYCDVTDDHFQMLLSEFQGSKSYPEVSLRTRQKNVWVGNPVLVADEGGAAADQAGSSIIEWEQPREMSEESGVALRQGQYICVGDCPPNRSGSCIFQVHVVESTDGIVPMEPISPRKMRHGGLPSRNEDSADGCGMCGAMDHTHRIPCGHSFCNPCLMDNIIVEMRPESLVLLCPHCNLTHVATC